MSNFAKKIIGKKFLISVEINPNKSGDLSKDIAEVEKCAEFVNVLNVTDSSMARCKPASFVVAAELQKKFNLPAIFNFTTRDRNKIGIKSDLLGAKILGAINILAVTGDHPSKGDFPDSKAVFEFSSDGLLQFLPEIDPIFFGGAVLNFSENIENLEKIALRKKTAGAKFLISQPVFTKGRIEILHNIQNKIDLPIIAGILPIPSRRVANYIQKYVAGITIPPDDFENFQRVSDEEILANQILNAKKIFNYAKEKKLAGTHFMPLGKSEKIAEIIN